MPFVKLQYNHVIALLALLEADRQAHLDNPTEYEGLTTDEESAYATLLLMRSAMETVAQAKRNGTYVYRTPQGR